ncbi:hypothetical protein NQ314_009729 [Rhamnusium bicolor]|uniref:Uncharacterized protein n=1 Tax=Rhamnusium bicolor TaxID=1586634 RepID=A0AAV8XYV4_9CUCU|nr:hypothetical protein NQ314_009729 [Rhamnusium bicolor]
MAFKIVALAALLTVAQAGVLPAAQISYAAPARANAAPLAYAAPIAKTIVAEEYDPHPQYNYAYQVQDSLTGDSKSQHEVRDGDVVQGSYSLIDADGFKRTVEYASDPHTGFNAVVHREPLGPKAVVAKVAAPVDYAAPVAKIATPIAYAGPVGKLAAYSAPPTILPLRRLNC